MTLDELWKKYQAARMRRDQYLVDCHMSNTKADPARVAQLKADVSFREQTWRIAKTYSMEAALLFKMSDGAIDPRN